MISYSANRNSVSSTASSVSSSTSSSPATSPTSAAFQELLSDIKLVFSRSDCRVDVDELWALLEGYRSNPIDWAKYAYYADNQYKRNLIEGHEKYCVMLLTWAPGVKSSIHDHSGSHCFMKVLDGELVESRYSWPDEESIGLGEMNRVAKERMGPNEIIYINDKVGLHRVENPDSYKSAVSLHVYIPPYKKCRTFDENTGRANVCKLTFFSEYGRVVDSDQPKKIWPNEGFY